MSRPPVQGAHMLAADAVSLAKTLRRIENGEEPAPSDVSAIRRALRRAIADTKRNPKSHIIEHLSKALSLSWNPNKDATKRLAKTERVLLKKLLGSAIQELVDTNARKAS